MTAMATGLELPNIRARAAQLMLRMGGVAGSAQKRRIVRLVGYGA